VSDTYRAVPVEALDAVPLFPLSNILLLPGVYLPIHIFEPRYRRMVEDALEGHELIALGALDERLPPDAHGRPSIFDHAGLGLIQRSTRYPDGRFDLLIAGCGRLRVVEEFQPQLDIPYRRVKTELILDHTETSAPELSRAMSGLRSLCTRVVVSLGDGNEELLSRINEIDEAGVLADTIAVAAVQEPDDRRRILAEPDPAKRIEIVNGVLGALLLQQGGGEDDSGAIPGWGVGSGQA
jgi:Lon protease-like protein